ncbi:MAG: hypothetical protein ACXWWC_11575 [Chitinophagaceae bacterium]
MNQIGKYLHLYIGCNTNKGIFIGIREDTLFIQPAEKLIEEYNIRNIGNALFLYLRQLSDLTDEQSKQLIKEGLSIGRPHGYTFTNYGFLYLLSLSVDLFGLINAGFAKDMKTLNEKDH